MSQTTWAQFESAYNDLEAQKLTLSNVDSWLRGWSELTKEVQEVSAGTFRAKNEDTMNESAEAAFLQFVQEVIPRTETADQALKHKLLALERFIPEPSQNEFIRRLRNETELFREANVSLFADEQTLSSEFSKLTGRLTVELEGETLTIPETEKRLRERDREVREQAWRAVRETELSMSSELDMLFLKLLSVRRKIAKNVGLNYRDFRWRELNRFDYTPEESRQFHDAIAAEVTPLRTELLQERATGLNLATLRPWDLQVDPYARSALKPFDTVQELEDGMTRIFGHLDPELAEQFRSLRDGWLDLEARKGKVPGFGYQSFFPKQEKPYIYHSVNKTHTDVWVLVHESGHAFHSLAAASHNSLVWNFETGTEFAEVASQTMELLMLPYLSKNKGGFYNAEDTARARREGLERVILALPNLAYADAFQHWLYAEAPEDVSIEAIDAKWIELSEQFAPGVNWAGLEHLRAKGWQSIHIFAEPFYMLEYAFAWLGAVQIWRNALENPKAALQKYRAALALGGTRPLPELFETAGARFAFDRETVGEAMRFVYGQR